MEMGVYEKAHFPDAQEIVASFGVRSLQVGVPNEQNIDTFEKFIEDILAPNGVNYLLLCLDYWFEFKRHPEIADEPYTTHEIAARVARSCRKNSITVVPVINVLAHQSAIFNGWTNKGMLRAYPDMEEVFDGELHSSKCLCSRHPLLRPIVYDMVDELMEAFDTKIIHAGFDEVWDIGKCPRCRSVDGYRLFAEYINDINHYIKSKGGRMWIWGDQLVDGKLVPDSNPGYETCLTELHKAVDLINTDIVICDWHYYDEPYGQLAPSYWAMRNFDFIECTFNSPKGAEQLLYATRVVRSEKTLGTMLTSWCKLERFMEEVYTLYPSYLETGILPKFKKEDEDSGIEKSKLFAMQAAAMFMKLFVPR